MSLKPPALPRCGSISKRLPSPFASASLVLSIGAGGAALMVGHSRSSKIVVCGWRDRARRELSVPTRNTSESAVQGLIDIAQGRGRGRSALVWEHHVEIIA
jgi:hypothetical protein